MIGLQEMRLWWGLGKGQTLGIEGSEEGNKRPAGEMALGLGFRLIRCPSVSTRNLSLLLNTRLLSQILAMASKVKKDALRLVHTGSLTTFSNWPTSR